MSELQLDKKYIIQYLNERFVNKIFDFHFDYGILGFHVKKAHLLEICGELKTDPILKLNFLTDLCGNHFPERKEDLMVIYHLHSFEKRIRIKIKTACSTAVPTLPSLTPIWPSANWMERETYDFYGIEFQGHPDLKRILNLDDMQAFPLKKEYPLEDPNRMDKEDKYFGR